jgi:effector-binding domain-containing protein
MNIETVDAKSGPILYVTRSASMAPEAISGVMGEAFGTMGAFVGRAGIAPAGPPLAIYRDWDERTGRMKIDIAFPVGREDAAKAEGEVKAGHSPSGKALRVVHCGPYDKLRDTYGEIMAHMKKAALPMPPMSWEVYVGDPETTPPDDLVTEIYMPVP